MLTASWGCGVKPMMDGRRSQTTPAMIVLQVCEKRLDLDKGLFGGSSG